MGRWYRGEVCNFYPLNKKEIQDLEKYLLKGFIPKEPFLNKKTKITAFGSCFAEHVSKYLCNRKYNVSFPAGLSTKTLGAGNNNTFALRYQFEKGFLNKPFNESYWWGKDSDAKTPKFDGDIKPYDKKTFLKTDVFILTLGLSEVWFNKTTDDVYWRGIPKELFDKDIHGFRLTTVDENINNLQKIIDITKKYQPRAQFIITVSPVPLAATFRSIGCIGANEVSKSILRVAADVITTNNNNCYYYPSYEIIRNIIDDPYKENDLRHIKPQVVDQVMRLFEKYYCL